MNAVPATDDPLYARVAHAVRDSADRGLALAPVGGGSKRTLCGRRCDAAPLPLHDCSGIVSYRPEEMVLTARAGTTVADLVAAAEEAGQCLPFEPPQADGATLGGTVACGLSGPARPWRGSVRDAVLGTRLVNGRGELLRYGGEVMKNVAGYDVSRLQCGALGTLGVLVEVSLRLLPRAETAITLSQEMSASAALQQMRDAAKRGLPLSGACWHAGTLYLRLEGHGEAVAAARSELPHVETVAHTAPWPDIRDYRLPELSASPLWCVSLGPASRLAEEDLLLLDWGGARRYYSSDDASRMHALAAAGSGNATRLWSGTDDCDVLLEPPAAMRKLLERLKDAMDPQRMLSPGRLYPWL